MASPADFTVTTQAVCATCFKGGTVVEMESLDDVTAGNKRECPTCSGTTFLILNEQELPAE